MLLTGHILAYRNYPPGCKLQKKSQKRHPSSITAVPRGMGLSTPKNRDRGATKGGLNQSSDQMQWNSC